MRLSLWEKVLRHFGLYEPKKYNVKPVSAYKKSWTKKRKANMSERMKAYYTPERRQALSEKMKLRHYNRKQLAN